MSIIIIPTNFFMKFNTANQSWLLIQILFIKIALLFGIVFLFSVTLLLKLLFLMAPLVAGIISVRFVLELFFYIKL